jgi:hypothetical protein
MSDPDHRVPVAIHESWSQTKHLIRAGLAITLAWFVTFAVMFIAFYGHLPKAAGMTVFLFSASCVFPYNTFILPERAKEILTISHWVLSILLFTFSGKRLRLGWAFLAAIVVIPLLALFARVALQLIGFPRY